ncbi:hypothetical protein EV644_12954 [Kribbella orskensis]|uniref:3'-phosphate/5'-hydroxy nucleic acid ligase n=1 Tax=Kribbella orskensis TaxID=2512216 RepID=A0ABY2B8H3_9ACTN|nr:MULTISPECIES: RtcB family protein [Kribbella]TCN31180.1 hypothetical protein EV642_13154 [Kribbella sp. VKM Ac-2500]TCO11686.1 hypothetical protein EV644_12954 [Kribbella orskensis]
MRIVEETPYRLRIEPEGRMRVAGIVFASRTLLPHAEQDKALQQVCNVATLPGIVVASFAMPDVHLGVRIFDRRCGRHRRCTGWRGVAWRGRF